MEPTASIRFCPVPHPSTVIRQTGFPIEHPYLEECWTSVLGPSSTILLRRLIRYWETDPAPVLKAKELAACVGIGNARGRHGSLQRTIDRLIRFDFAESPRPGELDVFTQIAPIPDRHLRHVVRPIRLRHEELLDAHLTRLAELTRRLPRRDLGADAARREPTRPTRTLHR